MSKQNVPAGMLPFDLETALAYPDRVRTRDGQQPTELCYFKTIEAGTPALRMVVRKRVIAYYNDGRCWAELRESPNDLFLTSPTVERFVNVYTDNVVSSEKNTLGLAKAQMYHGDGKAGTICKLTIQNGEVIAHETVHRYNAE